MTRIAAAQLATFPAASGRNFARTALVAAALLAAFALQAPAEPLANACQKTYSPQTLDDTQPLNLQQVKEQAYFYACSGAYDSDLNKVLARARGYVEMRAAQVAKPAIVLDIDETSLSNLPVELADDFAYIPQNIPCKRAMKDPCGFDNWVEEAWAKPIDGTLALFKAAKAHHAAVFFITGRHENEEEVTVKNLKAAGFEGWAGLALRPMGDKRSVIAYKSSERGKIAKKGYTIIANVGDQQSDLTGGYAERAYKLPNPFYYIP
jgi:predicted secreted acid phosphatase